MRCLVLAKKLKALGYEIIFASRPQAGDFIDFIEESGFEVLLLDSAHENVMPKSDSDYEAWLQVPIDQDAVDLCNKVNKVDVVVVDHYGICASWERFVSSRLSCKIVAIDDLVRRHQADLIVDQTYGRGVEEYYDKAGGAKVLTGGDYALLGDSFAARRPSAVIPVETPTSPKVLVSMGAVDAPNATLQVLAQLACLDLPELSVTVVLGQRSPNYEAVSLFCDEKSAFTHVEFTRDMAGLLSKHNIAIGAPGTSAWERACLGIPSLVIPIAKNQLDNGEALSRSGAALLVTLTNIKTEFKSKFYQLLDCWVDYRAASLKLVDGLGAGRVSNEIVVLTGGSSE